MRRRALLASSANSKGSSIFPIYLVVGNNGEIGKTLFQFVYENSQDAQYITYRFSDDEIVIINSEYAENKRIVHIYQPAFASNLLAIEYENHDSYHYLELLEDGTVTEYYDD